MSGIARGKGGAGFQTQTQQGAASGPSCIPALPAHSLSYANGTLFVDIADSASCFGGALGVAKKSGGLVGLLGAQKSSRCRYVPAEEGHPLV